MDAYQRGKSRESMAATEQMLEKQTPEARSTELADVTRDREASLRDTVGAAQAFDAPATAGKTSADFQRAQEAQAQSSSERIRRAIEQLATMGAPGEQKLKHQLRFGRAAGVVDASNQASESVGQAYMNDIRNVRPDPFLSLLSDIGMGVGTGMALAPAGAAASGSVVPNSGMAFETVSKPATSVADRLRTGFSLWGR